MRSLWLCYASFLIPTLAYLDAVSSLYSSASTCTESSSYGNQTSACTGRGTSNTSDALGNLLNGNEKYGFIVPSSLSYTIIVTEIKYQWQPGKDAVLYIPGVLGLIFQMTPVNLVFLNFNGDPKYQYLRNDATPVNGVDGLTGADCYTVYNLVVLEYPLPCNVFPVSSLVFVPYASQNLNLAFELSGIRSLVARKNSVFNNINLSSRAQQNIIHTSVSMQNNVLTSTVYVAEPGSSISVQCTLETTNADVMLMGSIAVGTVGDAGTLNLTDVCSNLSGVAAQLATESPPGLFIYVVIVIYTTEGVFTSMVGYTYNTFVTPGAFNALVSACEAAC